MNTEELKALRTRLKSGNYDGKDIMGAWLAIDRLIAALSPPAAEPVSDVKLDDLLNELIDAVDDKAVSRYKGYWRDEEKAKVRESAARAGIEACVRSLQASAGAKEPVASDAKFDLAALMGQFAADCFDAGKGDAPRDVVALMRLPTAEALRAYVRSLQAAAPPEDDDLDPAVSGIKQLARDSPEAWPSQQLTGEGDQS